MSRLPSGIPFTIGVVSKLTGISADTLRVWEKRYGFPQPQRRGKGVRVYSDQDLEKLRLAATLLEMGYRPGDVMTRSVDELRPLLVKSGAQRAVAKAINRAKSIDQIIQGLVRYNIQSVTEALTEARESLGLVRFVREIARPLMERVGDLWADGSLDIRHEHLMTDLLGTELRTSTAEIRFPDGPRVLLATVPGEQHGLGLDLWSADLAGSGVRPYVLGADLPVDQIAKTAAAVDTQTVAIYVSSALSHATCEKHIAELLLQLPRRTMVWLAGKGAEQLASIPDGARIFVDYDEYDRAIDELILANRDVVAN